MEAIILVSLVIYLFLQSWRAALIPILSVPVSLTGAFIGMYLLGYSINTLTLFGLVLAIGIVVDDAIVVIENMERILQTEKLKPREAALKAMMQVSGPVIAIVLVMCAVFIPATFVGGMTGQLYKQFAATIAISVVFSGFMAITFAPAIGALILKQHEAEPARFFRWFNAKFALMTDNYVKRSGWMIRKSSLVFLVYLSTYGFIYFFNKTLPTAFVPMEDQGYFITSINLPDGATTNRTVEVVKEVEKILKQEPTVAMFTAITGLNIMTFSQEPNSATIFVRLKPWSERKTKELSLFGALGSVGKKYRQIKEANVIAMPPPPIRGMGPSDMFSFKLLQMGDTNMTKLAGTTNDFLKKLKDEKALKMSFTTMRADTPTLMVEVDREKAKSFGVAISDIFTTLQSSIGYINVNQFDKNGKTYWVQVQSDAEFRSKPEDIGKAWVRSSSGKLLPLSNFVRVHPSSAPSTIEHFNGSLATTIMGSPAAGFSSGEIIKLLEHLGDTVLPGNTTYDWEGLYLQEKLVGSKAFVIMAFALVLVYLILAALYEKWMLPISIMLAVPYGIAGAYAVVWVIPFLNNNVFFQIGLLTLIGLSAKNAILVVEFAEDQRKEGKSIYDATMEAARLRFRPMMMTSVAFLAGMLPLIMSSGAGAMSRFSIGVAMFGGMMAATFIERFFIPFLYYWVATAREKILAKRGAADEN
jgi:hydrophobe/amphiphile efflux-1 (HAE1) family protein